MHQYIYLTIVPEKMVTEWDPCTTSKLNHIINDSVQTQVKPVHIEKLIKIPSIAQMAQSHKRKKNEEKKSSLRPC